MAFPFSTKKTNLRLLNIGIAVWVIALAIPGTLSVMEGLHSGKWQDAQGILLMLAGGIFLYCLNRFFLHLSYLRRATANKDEIVAARKMLSGDRNRHD